MSAARWKTTLSSGSDGTTAVYWRELVRWTRSPHACRKFIVPCSSVWLGRAIHTVVTTPPPLPTVPPPTGVGRAPPIPTVVTTAPPLPTVPRPPSSPPVCPYFAPRRCPPPPPAT